MKRWILALSVMCCVSVADAEDVDTAAVADMDLPALFDYASRYPDTEERQELKQPAFQELLSREERAIEFLLAHVHIKNIWYQVYLQQLIPRVDAKKAMPALRAALRSEHVDTRRTAVYFLGLYEDRYDATELLPLLQHKKTRGLVVRTLGKWQTVEQRPAVLDLLKNGNERERVLAVNALRDMGADEDATDALISALNDDMFTVRLAAARALAVYDQSAVKAVIKALDAERRDSRETSRMRELIRTLGAMESTRGDRPLKKLTRHDDAAVARDAKLALEKAFRPVLGL